MEPSSPNDGRNVANPFQDSEAKAGGQKSPDLPKPFGNFRLSKKSVKKANNIELRSTPEKSIAGKDDDQREGTNPFEDPEPKSREKSPGLPNPFGSFRISKKNSRKKGEGEQQNSSEKEPTVGRDFKDKEQKDRTSLVEEPEPQAVEKSPGLPNPFGNFRISKKSSKKGNDTELQSSPEKSIVGKDSKVQAQREGANPFEDPESKTGEKSQGLTNPFGNFRISKKNTKKAHEEEELDPPEKKESTARLSQIFKDSKKAVKRHSLVEKLNSPDKKEPFGQLGVRLSKIYHKKQEHAEEPSSPDKKESPGVSASLVNKLKTSMKVKKKIDFNEHEENNKTDELMQEDKMEAVEEDILLSVMEINELIHGRQLQKAFRSIKFMEDKLIEESQGDNYYENITEFTIRAKDVDLLYGSLFNMVRSIVKETLNQEVDEPLVATLVQVIEDEAIIHENTSVPLGSSEITLGQPRRWKHLWKEAVKDSVVKRIESVPLNPKEESWLPNHLETLKVNTLTDLIKVKSSLMSLYPKDYKVCSIYLQSFHDALSSHIQKNVVTYASELSQLYSLLDFTMNKYKSEEFMANPELHPEINAASLPPVINGECLEKLKKDYNIALQEVLKKKYFHNIMEMEKNKWEKEMEVDEETFKELPIYTDIERIIGTYVRESSKLSEELERSTFHICVEHLGSFSTRLQETFMAWSGNNFKPLSIQYSVVYINSLTKLRHNTTQSDADECQVAETNINTAIETLKQHIFHLFTKDTKPHFQKLITKTWLKKSTAFSAIMKSAKILCQCVKYLTSPHEAEMACRVHKYLVKEYIAQIMKRKVSLNPLNRKKAAERMKEECKLFNSVAEDMGSNREGLYEVICCISEIIGSKKKEEIKPKLEDLHHLYPDVSEEHILCILHVQGTGRSRKLLEHFHQLQKNHQPPNEPEDKLFSEIDCVSQVACFSCNFSAQFDQ